MLWSIDIDKPGFKENYLAVRWAPRKNHRYKALCEHNSLT